jgi:hypothetical protein
MLMPLSCIAVASVARSYTVAIGVISETRGSIDELRSNALIM